MVRQIWASVLLIGAAGSLTAQEFRATLQGSVTDPSNAAIAGAQLTLRSIETGVERQTTTNQVGSYVFQFLPPGRYALSTRAAGFKSSLRDNISLSLGDTVRVDVELAVGEVTETVNVSGEVVTVQT